MNKEDAFPTLFWGMDLDFDPVGKIAEQALQTAKKDDKIYNEPQSHQCQPFWILSSFVWHQSSLHQPTKQILMKNNKIV